jgi:hypothetical protein
LQFFGENEFELAVLDSLEATCLESRDAIYFLPADLSIDEQNELNRLKKSITDRNFLFVIDTSNCFKDFEHPSLLLVDENRQLRGKYKLKTLEIDRAVVEVDLLMSLQNGTND